LYSGKGVLITEDVFKFIEHGSVLYIALKGEKFEYRSIMDNYLLKHTLGKGGFGKVMLA